jgi:diacylglycerol kinase (ATP)
MDRAERRPRRLLVIFNPTAGRRKRRRFQGWLDALAVLGAPVTLRETNGPRHAEALARSADPALFDAVAVAGGDGTINEAVNGLALSPLALAIFPLGTANVLAAEIGLPRGITSLAHLAAFAPASPVWPGEAVAEGASVGRRFLVMAGVGFDADVVASLDLALKRRIGKLAYVMSILGRLRDYRPAAYRADLDGRALEAASLVAAKSHFYGGRFVLAPKARLDDPTLQVAIFQCSGRASALGYLAAMGLGLLPHWPGFAVVTAKNILWSEPVGAPVQLDGDVQVRLPLRVRIAATPLRLIRPSLT